MDPIMTVYSIENGFLLEFNNGQGTIATIYYAKNEKEIAEQVIAQKARLVLEGPKQGEMFPQADMGPTSPILQAQANKVRAAQISALPHPSPSPAR